MTLKRDDINFLNIVNRISKLVESNLSMACTFKIPHVRYGNISTNAPTILHKKENISLEQAFERIKKVIAADNDINQIIDEFKLENAFCNIRFKNEYLEKSLQNIAFDGDFGQQKSNIKVNVEYVSANPTGPLHIGHLRGVYADTLCNIMEFCGYKVDREYFVNDMGNQIDLFVQSIRHECNILEGKKSTLPDAGYKGEYIKQIAQKILEGDGAINCETSVAIMVEDAKHTLEKLNIRYDITTYESDIHNKKFTQQVCNILEKQGKITYEQPPSNILSKRGQSTQNHAYIYRAFKEDDGKVLLRHDASPTYWGNDLGYTLNKIQRGYNKIIVMYGVDHMGHVDFMKKAFEDIKSDTNNASCEYIPIFHEIITLKKQEKHFKMSKRSGVFISAADVIEVLNDPLMLRFFILSKRVNTAFAIDIDEIETISNDNPFYYIQYAYARASSLLKRYDDEVYKNHTCSLDHYNEEMLQLNNLIQSWPLEIDSICKSMNPCSLLQYVKKISEIFHKIWALGQKSENYRFIVDDDEITKSRLLLVFSFRNVFSIAINILGVKPYTVLKSDTLCCRSKDKSCAKS